MKHCPFCAEEIQDAAIVCKHCQRDLVPAAAPPAPPVVATPTPATTQPSAGGTVAWTAVVLVGMIVVFAILSNSPGCSTSSSPSPTPEMIARGERVVEGSLRDGLIEKIVQPASAVYVDPRLWATLTITEKEGFGISCAYYFRARGEPGFANIHDNMTGRRLAHVVAPASFVMDE